MTCRVPHAALVLLLSVLGPASSSAAASEPVLDEAVREYQAALDAADRDQRLARFRRAELLFSRLVAGEVAENTKVPPAPYRIPTCT